MMFGLDLLTARGSGSSRRTGGWPLGRHQSTSDRRILANTTRAHGGVDVVVREIGRGTEGKERNSQLFRKELAGSRARRKSYEKKGGVY